MSTQDVFFSGISVANLNTAWAWYVGLLGRAADKVEYGEIWWRVADNQWFSLGGQPYRAGHALLTIAVADLAKTLRDLEGRGFHCAPTDIDAGTIRSAAIEDPEGNWIVFVESASADAMWVNVIQGVGPPF